MNGTSLAAKLKQVFGYDSFRPLQQEIMETSLAGRDAVAILPTGAGKSLCYQLPALVRPGLTVVVSPLIALMKDQVDQLEAAGVAATFLNSSLDATEARRRLEGLDVGRYQLLYVAPERLVLPDFLPKLRNWKVTALAVDEAHCISEWGHDFRPEYRRLREVRKCLPQMPILALTATATPRVREDIILQLELREPAVFLASFNRPNLNYQVVAKSNAPARIAEFIATRAGESGIVYCQSRKSTESLAATLRALGFPAVAYHAGLEPAERVANQDHFLRDRAKIVCATVAFGMGINKPDVRFVIHADLPKNIEGYYQETGRAGRDGLPADCLLLFSRGDLMKQARFIDEIPDAQARENAHRQLEAMASFAESDGCRRVGLLGYFGEHWPHENCGACDHCLNPREKLDASTDARKLLSCVLRIRQGPPQVAGASRPSPLPEHPAPSYSSPKLPGLGHVADILTGSLTEKVRARDHDKLSTFGIGKDQARAYWVNLGRQLLQLNVLESTGGQYPVVSVSKLGMLALKEQRPVMVAQPLEVPWDKPAARHGDVPCDPGLFEQLRVVRKRLADSKNVPPYVVFSDVTLRHLCREYPVDVASLLLIPGIGEKKQEDYGNDFLTAIHDWLATNPRLEFAPLPPAPPAEPRPRLPAGGSVFETLTLWKSGMAIPEIAKARSFAVSTIESHLAQAIENGEALDPRAFYTAAEEREMAAAMDGYDEVALKPIFDQLEGKISYGKLRIYRAVASTLEPA